MSECIVAEEKKNKCRLNYLKEICFLEFETINLVSNVESSFC